MAIVSRVESLLEVLLDNLSLLEEEIEQSMQHLALVVDDSDPKLQQAVSFESPNHTGRHVTFAYYQAMKSRRSSNARYITKQYEKASRDMTGNGLLDLLKLVDITLKEALLIKNFIPNREEILGTAAEQKVLENFEVWLQTAIVQTKRIHEELKDTAEKTDRRSGQGKTQTSKEARRSQALSKVRLNQHNLSIVQETHALERNFSASSDFLYKKFAPGAILDARAIDNLVLAQEQRNRLFREKLDLILGRLASARQDRQNIKNLSDIGKSLPKAGRCVMVKMSDDDSEIDFRTEETFAWEGTHNSLPDLDKGDPHSQYLLKSGGTLTGDLEVAEGVRIDGVDVSEHRHTGQDGSSKVNALDIAQSSMSDDLVDTESLPVRPENLTVSRIDATRVPPGVNVIDTFLEWDGSDEFYHEVEVRWIPTIKQALVNDSHHIISQDAPTITEGSGGPMFSYNAIGGLSDYYLSLAFADVMLRYEDNAYDVVEFDSGLLGSTLASGTLAWPSDYLTTGTLEFVSDTGTEWLVAHTYTTGDFASYARLMVRILHINKTTHAVTVDSAVQLYNLPFNDYTDGYISPRAIFDGTRLTACAFYSDASGSNQNFSMAFASALINTSSGAVSGVTEIAATPWHTEVGSFADQNYALPVTPIILHDGKIAFPFTSGSHVTSDNGERQGCYLYVVDPTTTGIVDSVEISTRPSYWGALAARATPSGIFVVAALNDDTNYVVEGNRGEWNAYHYAWSGSALTLDDSTTFTNADYLDDGAVWSNEYGFGSHTPSHETEVFASSIVTVYSNDDGRNRWATIPWDVTGGTVTVGAETFHDLVALSITPADGDLQDGTEHRWFNRLSESDDGYFHWRGRKLGVGEYIIGMTIAN